MTDPLTVALEEYGQACREDARRAERCLPMTDRVQRARDAVGALFDAGAARSSSGLRERIEALAAEIEGADFPWPRETLVEAIRALAAPAHEPGDDDTLSAPTRWVASKPLAAPAREDATPPEEWVVESTDARTEDALFWRPKDMGYTTDLSAAGRYTREEAEKRAKMGDAERAHRLADVMALARPTVDRDRLRAAPAPAAAAPPARPEDAKSRYQRAAEAMTAAKREFDAATAEVIAAPGEGGTTP
jgi:hypothetical protein